MSNRATIEQLLDVWDGDIPELISLLQLLNRVRDRGVAFGVAKTQAEHAAEIAQFEADYTRLNHVCQARIDEIARLQAELKEIGTFVNERWSLTPSECIAISNVVQRALREVQP